MRGYLLAITSHKGGTGRTTTALALAWLWGEQGLRVTLVDADPSGAARLAVCGLDEHSSWPNVHIASEIPALLDSDIVVIDCPSLSDPSSRRLLDLADGALLTCLVDLMALRTLPVATRTLSESAKVNNGRRTSSLEMHGVLLTRYREEPMQVRLVDELRRMEDDLLLRPEIAEDADFRNWPLLPGDPMPDGPARRAYERIAEELALRLGMLNAVG